MDFEIGYRRAGNDRRTDSLRQRDCGRARVGPAGWRHGNGAERWRKLNVRHRAAKSIRHSQYLPIISVRYWSVTVLRGFGFGRRAWKPWHWSSMASRRYRCNALMTASTNWYAPARSEP